MIEVKLEPRPAPAVQAHRAPQRKSSRGTSARPPRSVTLSELGLPFDPSTPAARLEPPGKSLAFDRESKELGLNRYLFEQIDRNLAYPAELAQNRIQGQVQARLQFSGAGELQLERSELEATSPYLRVVVAKALRRGFAEPIPKSKRQKPGDFTVSCTFTFEITEHHDEPLAASRQSLLENEFHFYRYFHRSIAQWDLGPLHGLGPIPQLDVMWLPQKIGEAFSKKAKIDPLQKYRDDPAF